MVIGWLTKVEYGNTLRDLFGVDPSVAAELPDEVSGAGYLNTLSPLQSEKYLAIANEVLNRVAPKNGPPTKLQKRLFGGCHLTRPIVDLLTASGFTITELDVFYEKGAPKAVGATSLGVAVAGA